MAAPCSSDKHKRATYPDRHPLPQQIISFDADQLRGVGIERVAAGRSDGRTPRATTFDTANQSPV